MLRPPGVCSEGGCLQQISGTDPKGLPEAAGAPKAAEEAPKRLGALLGAPKGLGLAPKLKAFELGAPKGPARYTTSDCSLAVRAALCSRGMQPACTSVMGTGCKATL